VHYVPTDKIKASFAFAFDDIKVQFTPSTNANFSPALSHH